MIEILLDILKAILIVSGMFTVAIILPMFLFRLFGIMLGAY